MAAAKGAMSVQEQPTHAEIALHLLGPFEASAGGQQVVLGGQRQRAVLARLALAGGSIVPVERLIDELWDGAPPPSALNTLQSYVSNLRRAFSTPGSLVERVGPGYRVSLAPEQVDLHRFAAAVAGAADRELDPVDRVGSLDGALALWRGPALADFADQEWARPDIVRLEELRLTAMEARFDAFIEDGRHATVVGELEQAVRDHPLRERFCAQLMLALYRSGRQADALRAYERSRTYLGEEVGLDPGPDLQRLAGAILDHDAWLQDASAEATSSLTVAPVATAEAAPPPALVVAPCRALADHRAGRPFVGRAPLLAALRAQWERVTSSGQPSMVLVSGEAGIGKTRSVQHLAREVERGGGTVLWGRCTTDPDVVYQPLVGALLGALADEDPGRLTAAVRARPGLSPMLPNTSRDAAPAPTVDRLEVYEAAAELLASLAGSAPVLLVVDDAQWADAASLHVIEHVLRHHLTGRLLVVGTVRRPSGGSTPELDRLAASLRRDDLLCSLDLAGITEPEVAELLRAMGQPDGGAVAIHQRTAGNPFFIEQLATTGAGAEALPETVRDVLEARVTDLGADARAVLLAAAVLGARVELGVLEAVSGVDRASLLDITDRATDAGVLVEDDAVGWVAFPHALVRQSLLSGATRNRLAQLHLRAADALDERSRRPSTIAAVAHHLLDADALAPLDRRVAAVVAAARSSLASMAPEVTMTWLDRLVPLLAAVEEEGPEDRASACAFDAHLLAAAAQRQLGDRPASSAAAWAAVSRARSLRDPELLARATDAAARAVAGVGFDIGEPDPELLSLMDEALAAIGGDPSEARATLLSWSAAARTGVDDPLRDEHSLEALRISEVLGDPAVAARAGLARRLAAAGPFGLPERLTQGPLALGAAVAAGDVELEIVNLVFDVVDLLESGRVEASVASLETLRSRLAPLASPSADTYLHFLDANMALLRGDLQGGEAAAAAGLAAGELAHGGNALQAWAAQQFLLAWSRGTLGELAPMVGQIADERPTVPIWRVALAGTLVAAGDPAAERLCAELGVSAHSQYRGDSQWGVSMATLAEVAWCVGDERTGAVVAELLAPLTTNVAVTAMGAVSVGHIHRAHGLAVAVSGDLDAGLASVEAAVLAARQAGFHVWLARALHDRSLLLARRGRRGDAAAAERSGEEAASLSRRLGAALTLAPGR